MPSARKGRHFFHTAIPESIRAKVAEGEGLTKDDMVTSQRILNQHGWCTVNWPVEWGGKDWSPVQVYLYRTRCSRRTCRHRLPSTCRWSGRSSLSSATRNRSNVFSDDGECGYLLVPGLQRAGFGIGFGVAAHAGGAEGQYLCRQRAEDMDHAGAICRLDLLSLRTDTAAKQQEGISFLLIDMKTPGITVRPIITIDGGREVNEVFFDNVVVPAENLVDEENRVGLCEVPAGERTDRHRAGRHFEGARLRRNREHLAALEHSPAGGR